MEFYFTPGSCSTGIHILLEEVGEVFSATRVNLLQGDHLQPSFMQLNPKATIPVLVLKDGTVLTDFLSIAWWVGGHYPRRKLLPEDLVAQANLLGWMNYIVNTIHGQGYTRFFTPEKYTAYSDQHGQIKAQGRELVLQGFEVLSQQVSLGNIPLSQFTLLDAALFYVLFWADRSDIAMPSILYQHYVGLLQRDSVRQVLMEEGYHSVIAEPRYATP